jgi:hypothetical protein
MHIHCRRISDFRVSSRGHRVRALLVLIALAFAARSALSATEFYRSVMPDGSVRYGEAPEPAAKMVRKIPAPPLSTAAP